MSGRGFARAGLVRGRGVARASLRRPVLFPSASSRGEGLLLLNCGAVYPLASPVSHLMVVAWPAPLSGNDNLDLLGVTTPRALLGWNSGYWMVARNVAHAEHRFLSVLLPSALPFYPRSRLACSSGVCSIYFIYSLATLALRFL